MSLSQLAVVRAGAMLITPSRSQHWQRTMKPDIGSGSRFLHTQPNLHSMPLLCGFPSEYCHYVWCAKTRMVWLPDGEKNFEDMFIRFDRIHKRGKQTHRQTDIAWRHGPHLSIASCGSKLGSYTIYIIFLVFCVTTLCFKKKFTLLLFAITKSDVDRFQ